MAIRDEMQGKMSIEEITARQSELKRDADIKFLEWWFCRYTKVSEKLYEEYLELVRKLDAAGN